VNEDMARKLPRYVYNERNQSGTNRLYFRRGKGKRTRIEAEYGTDDFDAEYARLLTDTSAPRKAVAGVNSLSWLIRQYKQSSAYTGFSEATRRQRDNIFKHVDKSAGHQPYRSITRKTILAGRERRASTPAQARNFLDAMRGLFRWALESELVDVDPTYGIKNPSRPKGPGFEIWTDGEVEAFRAHWPLGTLERVWLEVLIGTGARRSKTRCGSSPGCRRDPAT